MGGGSGEGEGGESGFLGGGYPVYVGGGGGEGMGRGIGGGGGGGRVECDGFEEGDGWDWTVGIADYRHAFEHCGWEYSCEVGGERSFAIDDTTTCVEGNVGWKELFPNAGVDAIGADEESTGCRGVV